MDLRLPTARILAVEWKMDAVTDRTKVGFCCGFQRAAKSSI